MNAMTSINQSYPLLDRLPAMRGRYQAAAALADMTWLRVGGPAEILFRPADAEDLAGFLAATPADIPLTVIGAGANLLVRDGGVAGVVIRLGKGFGAIEETPQGLRIGAACANVGVALRARDKGLAGYEFLRGVPGTIGGALRMNAGAYGREMKDLILSARTLDRQGAIRDWPVSEIGYGYRHCGLPEGLIFIDALLRAEAGDRDAITRRMAEIDAERTISQPARAATGGSTFANPEGGKAWELIERAGCRGLRVGDARISERHCNFMINQGQAKAADLEQLGETVRQRVKDATGVELHWEIRRIGHPAEGEQ